MITASHNPPQYNGFKISKRKAKPVGEESGLAEIRKHAAMIDKSAEPDPDTSVEQRDLWEPYAKHVLRFLRPWGADGRGSDPVVVDASNGMAGTMIPKPFSGRRASSSRGSRSSRAVFRQLEGRVRARAEPAGGVANLARTCARRRWSSRAPTWACASTATRTGCAAVDAGAIIPCDQMTAALLARYFLKRAPRARSCTTCARPRPCARRRSSGTGGPVRGRVGHVFMKQLMAEHGACSAGS